MQVRAGTRKDVSAAAAILARAFQYQAPFTWIQPDEHLRAQTLPGFFHAAVQHIYPASKGAEVAVDRETIFGFALWAPPGRWKAPLLAQLLSVPTLIRAVGLKNLRQFGERGRAVEKALYDAHPGEPHWYLAALGVEPAAQDNGIGRQLVRSGLERCDRDGLPAYLECLEPLVAYYRQFGFQPVHTIDMPEDAPNQVGMLRPA